MKKLLSIMLALIFIAVFFSGCGSKPHSGDVSGVTVNVSGNSRYSKEQLNEAAECIKKGFASYIDCTLVKLDFKEDTETGVIFTGDFKTGVNSINDGFNSNDYYEDWSWELEYQNGGWVEVNHGYG